MISARGIDRRAVVGAAGAALLVGLEPGGGATRHSIRRREDITITDRGASLAGLRAAMREISTYGGGTIRLQARSIVIDTAELAQTGPVVLPGNVRLEGEGSRFLFVGDRVAPPLFVAQDVSQIVLRNIVATGNGRGVADTRSGGFALFVLSAAATGDMMDISLDNIQLSGFRAERWVQFLQRNPSGRRMAGLRVTDMRAAGAQPFSASAIGVSTTPLWFHGVEGEIQDIEVRRLSVQADALKQGVVFFHKIRRALVDSALIVNAGRTGAQDDAGAYAVMAYADPGEMSDIAIVGAIIRRPRSAGIYLRGAQRVRVINASISGQSDNVTTNLPKGAIALNGCSDVTIVSADLSNNRFDLSVADGGVNALDLEVRDMRTAGSGTSVILSISPGRGPIVGARFLGCHLSGRDRVLRVMNEQVPGRWYNDVRIVGGTLKSETAANIVELTQQNSTAASGYRIEDVTIQGNYVAIMASGLRGSLTIRRITIEGLGRLTYGIVADDCPDIDWDGITFRNIPDGYAYAARSLHQRVKGKMRGLRFDAAPRPFAAGSLAAGPGV